MGNIGPRRLAAVGWGGVGWWMRGGGGGGCGAATRASVPEATGTLRALPADHAPAGARASAGRGGRQHLRQGSGVRGGLDAGVAGGALTVGWAGAQPGPELHAAAASTAVDGGAHGHEGG